MRKAVTVQQRIKRNPIVQLQQYEEWYTSYKATSALANSIICFYDIAFMNRI